MRTIRRTISSVLATMSCAVFLVIAPNATANVMDEIERCNSCHGENGVSTESDVPTVAGISAFIIEEYLFMYRDDARPCPKSKFRFGDTEQPETDMCTISKELSEDVIPELAEYYSSKKFVAATQEFDAERAAVGAKIHRRDCEKCHADGGSYADDDAGILAGRWMPYLEQALANLASGEREILDEKMRKKIDAQDAASISALLHYYASQQ